VSSKKARGTPWEEPILKTPAEGGGFVLGSSKFKDSKTRVSFSSDFLKLDDIVLEVIDEPSTIPSLKKTDSASLLGKSALRNRKREGFSEPFGRAECNDRKTTFAWKGTRAFLRLDLEKKKNTPLLPNATPPELDGHRRRTSSEAQHLLRFSDRRPGRKEPRRENGRRPPFFWTYHIHTTLKKFPSFSRCAAGLAKKDKQHRIIINETPLLRGKGGHQKNAKRKGTYGLEEQALGTIAAGCWTGKVVTPPRGLKRPPLEGGSPRKGCAEGPPRPRRCANCWSGLNSKGGLTRLRYIPRGAEKAQIHFGPWRVCDYI